MYVRIEIKYLNKNLEILGIEEFTLNEYCHLLSQKTLSLLYQIEDLTNEKITYADLKKYIFNLAGSIERLPDNLRDDIKSTRIQKPENEFFDFLKRGE